MSKIKVLIIIAFSLLFINNIRLQNKVNSLDKELTRSINNASTWENIANSNIDNNNTLELTIQEYKNSNDSLIKVINDQQEKLKIKDNQLYQITSTETVIRDTIVEKIPINDTDFTIELKPNQLTTITVSRKDSIFTHTMEILNRQDLFIYTKKVYRNQYKNFFQRLIHLDFKKDKVNRYQIINSNDLIKVIDTRVINISE